MRKNPIVVIKLGTSSIVHEKTHQPLLSTLTLIVETAVALRRDGFKVVVVSSGAIGMALQKMGLSNRPKHLPQTQALAAIGQCRLMGLWEELFGQLDQTVAQILLTRNDISDRSQYLNAQNTFSELLAMDVIPIVNENDTLAVSEIIDKFGDNDTLSAITAGMIGADYLFLMTDVDCLYDKNPRKYDNAKPIEVVSSIPDLEADTSTAGSSLGTGGMSTKIVAARLATAAGVTTIITRSSLPGNILGVVSYIEAKKAHQRAFITSGNEQNDNYDGLSREVHPHSLAPPPLHTRFLPSSHRISDRKFWLLHGLSPHGTLYIDHGAVVALSGGRRAGLLPVGIIGASGSFAQQECVRLVEAQRPKQPEMQTKLDPLVSRISLSKPAANSDNLPGARPTQLQRNHSSSTSLPEILGTSVREVGRAVVNYSSIEIRRISGLQSTEISSVLGYADTEYVAFKENIALYDENSASKQISETTENDSIISGTESTGGIDADRLSHVRLTNETNSAHGSQGTPTPPETPTPGTPSSGRLRVG